MDAKVIEIRREQEGRMEKIEAKLDRVLSSLATTRDELSQTSGADKYKHWFFPSLLTLGLVIIGVIDLFKK